MLETVTKLPKQKLLNLSLLCFSIIGCGSQTLSLFILIQGRGLCRKLLLIGVLL